MTNSYSKVIFEHCRLVIASVDSVFFFVLWFVCSLLMFQQHCCLNAVHCTFNLWFMGNSQCFPAARSTNEMFAMHG